MFLDDLIFYYKVNFFSRLDVSWIGKHKNVDTTKYRIAIWNYIQSLYGIRHDDYEYSEVNKLLSRQIKTYIKTICCFPERNPKYLSSSALADFDTAEKVSGGGAF
ncbi:unnamed protein product [Soboliphyme baturini]|uniref:MADF domain-containing protein n=1 Tax=Soboliphyme baturini TaxID=241478 RepID=A0A183J3B5_9BILA|nr:unnamed protein product [Soboliphyme baturini]